MILTNSLKTVKFLDAFDSFENFMRIIQHYILIFLTARCSLGFRFSIVCKEPLYSPYTSEQASSIAHRLRRVRQRSAVPIVDIPCRKY